MVNISAEPEDGFDKVFSRIQKETGIKSIRQLSEIIGKKHQTILSAKNKNIFPANYAYEVAKKFNLSTDWIMTGKGEMLRGAIRKDETEEKPQRIEELEEVLQKKEGELQEAREKIIALQEKVIALHEQTEPMGPLAPGMGNVARSSQTKTE